MMRNKEISREVGLIYAWLDEQLNNSEAKGDCAVCGKCCDFEKYGHRLYVTTPEIMYFAEKVAGSDVIASAAKQSQTLETKRLPRRPDSSRRSAEPDSSGLLAMTTGQCSYQVEGPSTSLGMVSLSNHKCTVYPYRFSACRIFSCKANADFQSDLTETVIKKFKNLCEEFQIPYRYVDLPTALNDFSSPHPNNS